MEELRWKVLIAQCGPAFLKMTDAKQRSFARTVRDHMPHLERLSLPIGRAPAGMIARAGLFRVRDLRDIKAFLDSREQHVFLNVGTPDFTGKAVTVGAFFLTQRPAQRPGAGDISSKAVAQAVLPKSHDLAVVRKKRGASIRQPAEVPWHLWTYVSRRPSKAAAMVVEIDPLKSFWQQR